jgi:hypothetical protein
MIMPKMTASQAVPLLRVLLIPALLRFEVGIPSLQIPNKSIG